jgi:hypothetical protein
LPAVPSRCKRAARGQAQDGVRAARGRLEDRTSATPDRRRLECTPELPRFVADRCARIALIMAIPRRDLGDELFEGIRRPARADHDCAVLDRHVNPIAFVDLRLERDGFRKTQAQTVAPPRNLRHCGHVSTLNIRRFGRVVKSADLVCGRRSDGRCRGFIGSTKVESSQDLLGLGGIIYSSTQIGAEGESTGEQLPRNLCDVVLFGPAALVTQPGRRWSWPRYQKAIQGGRSSSSTLLCGTCTGHSSRSHSLDS